MIVQDQVFLQSGSADAQLHSTDLDFTMLSVAYSSSNNTAK